MTDMTDMTDGANIIKKPSQNGYIQSCMINHNQQEIQLCKQEDLNDLTDVTNLSDMTDLTDLTYWI